MFSAFGETRAPGFLMGEDRSASNADRQGGWREARQREPERSARADISTTEARDRLAPANQISGFIYDECLLVESQNFHMALPYADAVLNQEID